MRHILTLLLITYSAASLAQLKYSWSINSDNLAFVQSEKGLDYALYSPEHDSIVFMENRTIFDKCDPESEQEVVTEVNQKPVLMRTKCTDGGLTFVRGPVTDKGRDFVVNEFIKKNAVLIGDMRFSASGFKATRERVNYNEQNAL